MSSAEKRGHSSTERRWGVDWRDAKRHFFPPFFFSTQRPPLPVSVGVPRSLFSFLPSFFSPHFPLLCHRRFFPFETLPLPALFSGHHRGPSPNSVPSASSVAASPLFRIGGRPQKAFLLLSLFLPPLLLGWRCQHHRKVSLFGHPRSLPPPRRDGLDCGGGDIFPSSLSSARSRRPTTTQNGF